MSRMNSIVKCDVSLVVVVMCCFVSAGFEACAEALDSIGESRSWILVMVVVSYLFS